MFCLCCVGHWTNLHRKMKQVQVPLESKITVTEYLVYMHTLYTWVTLSCPTRWGDRVNAVTLHTCMHRCTEGFRAVEKSFSGCHFCMKHVLSFCQVPSVLWCLKCTKFVLPGSWGACGAPRPPTGAEGLAAIRTSVSVVFGGFLKVSLLFVGESHYMWWSSPELCSTPSLCIDRGCIKSFITWLLLLFSLLEWFCHVAVCDYCNWTLLVNNAKFKCIVF